jgi:putative membrane protein
MHMYHGGFGISMMLLNGIFMLLFWAIVIVAVIYIARKFFRKDHNQKAIEILKERYARGEISIEEYEERLKTLMKVHDFQ